MNGDSTPSSTMFSANKTRLCGAPRWTVTRHCVVANERLLTTYASNTIVSDLLIVRHSATHLDISKYNQCSYQRCVASSAEMMPRVAVLYNHKSKEKCSHCKLAHEQFSGAARRKSKKSNIYVPDLLHCSDSDTHLQRRKLLS